MAKVYVIGVGMTKVSSKFIESYLIVRNNSLYAIISMRIRLVDNLMFLKNISWKKSSKVQKFNILFKFHTFIFVCQPNEIAKF